MSRTLTTHSRARRGVTLLFVLSLIVLFLLMGAAFVSVTGNFMRTSRTRTRIDIRRDAPKTIIDRALFEAIRGPALYNVASPLRGHDLLSDAYGFGARGVVAPAPPPQYVLNAGNQLIQFTLGATVQSVLDNSVMALSDADGAYDGLIVTFVTDSTATLGIKGISARIFHYAIETDPGTGAVLNRWFVIAPEWSLGSAPFTNPVDLSGLQVVLNGRQFAGTGAAEAMAPGPNGELLTNEALQPNRSGDAAIVNNYLGGPLNALFGGPRSGASVNESYDAIDEQNVFLAAFDAANNRYYPSFYHRTAYNGFRAAGLPPLADLVTNATNSGAPDGELDWDVDNDGDGRRDSIWIDLGYPMQTGAGGRMYKPLFAFLILDLDGRFNLNVHGDENDASGRTVADRPLLGAPPVNTVLQGSGFVPSEISLAGFLPNAEYLNILRGDLATQYGRYGRPDVGLYGPGQASYRDDWSQYKLTGYPFAGIGDRFGLRMDAMGHYGWGFSDVTFSNLADILPYGMPVANAIPPADDLTDCTAELDFSGFPMRGTTTDPLILAGTFRDQFYSVSELERVLRGYDADASCLPSRFLDFAPSTLANPINRQLITTESWDVPVPARHLAQDLYNALGAANPGWSAAQINAQLRLMLAPELIQGLKLDINRWLGNGVDDNGNQVIDDYFVDDIAGLGEAAAGEMAPHPGIGLAPLDLNHDGYGTPDNATLLRQALARHLYMLALMKLGNPDVNGSGGLPDNADYQMIAQWAINAIDFRDPDAIMTPFEYDENPFNGWDVDGWLGVNPGPDGILGTGDDIDDTAHPDRRVVWGAERPELLITETLAAHDRRTTDEAIDNRVSDDPPDNDFDSRLMPIASAFIELYAPQVGDNDINYPRELYTPAGEVDLARTAATGSGHPVWRMMVVREDNEYGNPSVADITDHRNRDPDDRTDPPDAVFTYRYVYFVQPPVGYGANAANSTSFYPGAGIPGTRLVAPGQHAVVGSAGNVTGTFTTTFGRRVGAIEGNPVTLQIADTRSITLDPVNNRVRVRDFQVSPAAGMITRIRTGVVAIPLDQPRSFNVSDPTKGGGGYPLVDTMGNPAIDVGDGLAYIDPYDIPLDLDLQDYPYEGTSLKDDKTTPTYRVVHLQRLANPLADWHPVTNPYRTVDTMSMNLTAFNGVDAGGVADPNVDPAPLEQVRDFASMERGRNRKYPPSVPFRNLLTTNGIDEQRVLWSQDGISGTRRGFLFRFAGVNEINNAGNTGWHLAHDPAGADLHRYSSTVFETLGAFNDAYFDGWQDAANRPTNEARRIVGLPAPPPLGLGGAHPFTWLTWLNRPYSGPLELTLVPGSSSSRLLRDFSAIAAADPYANPSGFAHLLNYFRSDFTATTSEPGWAAVLDYIGVPSRYIGTERYFNVNAANLAAPPLFGLNPPYHGWSRFREPGKVNINTAFDPRVWNGAMGEYAAAFPYAAIDATRLTQGVFRAADTGAYVPLASTPLEPPQCSLFRPSAVGTNPLLDYTPAMQMPHNNTIRNAAFRYEARNRLGNLVTTRSNVFAIWVTVGYFEVDVSTGTPVLTGVEVGSDLGSVQRQRGFCIVDRSIPVAYEPGVNHNIEKAILTLSYPE